MEIDENKMTRPEIYWIKRKRFRNTSKKRIHLEIHQIGNKTSQNTSEKNEISSRNTSEQQWNIQKCIEQKTNKFWKYIRKIDTSDNTLVKREISFGNTSKRKETYGNTSDKKETKLYKYIRTKKTHLEIHQIEKQRQFGNP